MDNQEFLFLFDAVLRNEDAGHQGMLLLKALRNGYVGLVTATALRRKHFINWCSVANLAEARNAYLSTLALEDQLDRQQMAEMKPPDEFEQDPMNPCGATDPRF